jgi:photosystem II stability/assembly factor-like uncharacterized protein
MTPTQVKRTMLVLVVMSLAYVAALAQPPSAQALVSLGGGLYFQSPQPFGWSVGSLVAADSSNLWITTSNEFGSQLVHSSDGGATWQSVDLAFGHELFIYGLRFFDSSRARAVASWAEPSDEHSRLALLTSDDAGASWQLKPIASTGFSLSGCAFATKDDAFIIGTELDPATGQRQMRLLRTTNGGTSWKRFRLAVNFCSSLDAGDATHLWLVDEDDSRIWTSSDAGASWSAHTLPLQGKTGSSFVVEELDATSAKAAWVRVLQAASPHNIVMRTTSAGRRWERVASYESSASAALTAVSAREAWIAVTVNWAMHQKPVYFRHTTDGGTTWTRSYVGPSLGGRVTKAPGGVLFSVGDGLARSSDGGRTWTRLVGDSFGFWLNDVVVQPEGSLWAVGWTSPNAPGVYGEYDGGVGLLYRSSDGASWRQEEIPDGAVLAAIDFVDADVAWVVGLTGRVLRTLDGGTTWDDLSARENFNCFAVKGLNADSAIVIAFDENQGRYAILRTTDGGASWTEHPSGISDVLKRICEPSPGHLLIAGTRWGVPRRALLLDSSDAGVTWSERTVLCARNVRDMTFTDAMHGWILASDPPPPNHPTDYGTVVLHTEDGGTTWGSVDLGKVSLEGLNAIAFPDDQNGYLLGDRQLTTSDGGLTWTDTGAAIPMSAEGADIPLSTVRSAVLRSGELWAVGADELILSTVNTTADTAPPLTSDDGDRRWHHSAVTVHLNPADPGGVGVGETEWRVGSEPWQPLVGGAITIDAPSDHSTDGNHLIEYRSTDSAGNCELPEQCAVRIDTVPPATEAGGLVRTYVGKVAELPYRVTDAEPNGGTASVRVTIRTLGGRLITRRRVSNVAVNTWLRAALSCRFGSGRYSYAITATDTAGNAQTSIGKGRLVVLRR